MMIEVGWPLFTFALHLHPASCLLIAPVYWKHALQIASIIINKPRATLSAAPGACFPAQGMTRFTVQLKMLCVTLSLLVCAQLFARSGMDWHWLTEDMCAICRRSGGGAGSTARPPTRGKRRRPYGEPPPLRTRACRRSP